MKLNYVWKHFWLTVILGISSLSLFAQNGSIKGKVTDENGEPMFYANVGLEGTAIGAASDFDGIYQISNVKAGNYILVATFLGYKTVKQPITVVAGETSTVDFQLVADYAKLDEVVVIGYGLSTKRNVTGSISSVKEDALKQNSAATFQTALQGRAAGVQVTSANGMPGGAVSMRVRGTSSIISDTEPIYVIDGVVFNGRANSIGGTGADSNPLVSLNPADIESIEVLKDASAAAIYGARSANGVVLITTKKGKQGASKVDINYRAGIVQPTRKLPLLNGTEYMFLMQEAWENSGNVGLAPVPRVISDTKYNEIVAADGVAAAEAYNRNVANNTNTDWLDAVLRNGFVQEATVGVGGGDARNTYYVNFTYRDEQGYQIENYLKRGTFRFNAEHALTDRLRLGYNIGISRQLNKRVRAAWAGGLGTAQSRSLPIVPIYDENGDLFNPTGGTNAVALYEGVNLRENRTGALGNVFLTFQPVKGLTLRSDFGGEMANRYDFQHISLITTNPSSEDRRSTLQSWIWTNTIGYEKTVNDIHNLSVLAGIVREDLDERIAGLTGNTFADPSFILPASGTIGGYNDWNNQVGNISYLGRIGYRLKERYMIQASVRREGSSRFGPGKRFGVFPAVSAGWVISEEDFLKGNDRLSFLKLKAGWGLAGNVPLSTFPWIGYYSAGANYNGLSGISPSQLANPDLGWENKEQINAGIEYGLFNNRVSGAIEYYITNTSNLLLPTALPTSLGFGNITENRGSTRNQGFEFSVTSYNLRGAFNWTTEANITTQRNEVTNTNGAILSGNDTGGTFGNNYIIEGQPIGVWQLADYQGVNPDNGDETFLLHRNLTNDSGEVVAAEGTVIDFTTLQALGFTVDDIQVTMGNPYPKIFGGITNTFGFKGFDVAVLFTFAAGHNIYNDDGKFLRGGFDGNWNQHRQVLDRWQKPGDITDVPRLYYLDPDAPNYRNNNTSRYLEKGDFLRCKNLEVGYTLPKSITEKIRLERLRLFVNVNNAFIFTKYSGWDPEVNRDGANSTTQSVTYLAPPQARTIMGGININF